MKDIEIHVLAELEIIQDELLKVRVVVPLEVLSKWKVSSRAQVEQWAIKLRWSTMEQPPCPRGFVFVPGPMPAVVKEWVVATTSN